MSTTIVSRESAKANELRESTTIAPRVIRWEDRSDEEKLQKFNEIMKKRREIEARSRKKRYDQDPEFRARRIQLATESRNRRKEREEELRLSQAPDSADPPAPVRRRGRPPKQQVSSNQTLTESVITSSPSI